MKILLTICLLLAITFMVNAQTKEEIQDYIKSSLRTHVVKYEIVDGMTSSILVGEITFNDCVINYKIIEKNGEDVDSYIITMPLINIREIIMVKSDLGFYQLGFNANEKIITKKYKNGNMEYRNSQALPLEGSNEKVFDYFNKLLIICK